MIEANRKLQFAALVLVYFVCIIVPLILWEWLGGDSPFLLRLIVGGPPIALLLFVAIAVYVTLDKQFRRAGLAIGFSLYAFAYLGGNGLGMVGARWYWLHFTALCFIIATGIAIRMSAAYTENWGAVWPVIAGHWAFAIALIVMRASHVHRDTWVIFDYILGTYFAWCVWKVSQLRGIERNNEEYPG